MGQEVSSWVSSVTTGSLVAAVSKVLYVAQSRLQHHVKSNHINNSPGAIHDSIIHPRARSSLKSYRCLLVAWPWPGSTYCSVPK